ncbi:MAG: hypothetical protein R3Y11_01695 [Pseudomonadota bacterium]
MSIEDGLPRRSAGSASVVYQSRASLLAMTGSVYGNMVFAYQPFS